MLIKGTRLTPRDMTEMLDEEVEKDTHLGHAMATLRIDRGKWHRLGYMAFNQHWFESAFANRLGSDQIRKPRNAAPSDGKLKRSLAAVDLNSAPDVNDSDLAVVVEWPTKRGWEKL